LFVASLLFRSSDGETLDEEGLWEESLVLIDATSSAEAEEKAGVIGRARQTSYVAMDGTRVTWTFYTVERVFALLDQPLVHGAEVFSRYLRHAEVQSLLTPFDDDAQPPVADAPVAGASKTVRK